MKESLLSAIENRQFPHKYEKSEIISVLLSCFNPSTKVSNGKSCSDL